jgi:2-polyprenyl-6-methoxyphenol hydroxylase-like FAD-dependent oxidoreductase
MTKVLIIGGGIAGPVTAIALRKAGIDSVVYEAYDRGAEGAGAYLTLAVNGLDALRTLDLDEVVQGEGFDTPRIALFLGSGRRLADMSLGTLADGTVARTVKRAGLYRALRDEAVRRGVGMEHGKRLVGAESTSEGVIARFADGTQAEGDLLVGADGLHSMTRRIIDPAAPDARYVGLLNTGGYARGVSVDAEPGVMNMVFGKRCFFCYFLAPDGAVWWFANPWRPKEPSREELAAITPERWRAQLIELFEEDATPAVEIIQATPEVFSGWNTYDFPSVPHWHKGWMVIIGDAAHAASPSSGQGASMAIEDAVVLARCLRDAASVSDALEAYERARRARVEAIVKHGRRSSQTKENGLVGRVMRDLVLRMVFKFQARRGADPLRWMWDYHIDWDAPALASSTELVGSQRV